MLPSVAIDEVAEDLEGLELSHDPEATYAGIVQSEYDRYRTSKDLAPRPVEEIEREEWEEIYAKEYWSPLRCSQMPDGVDFAVFQAGVNIGITRAAKILQSVVSVDEDGKIGEETLRAINAKDPKQVISEFLDGQDAHYDEVGSIVHTRADGSTYTNDSEGITAGLHNRVSKVKLFLATGLTQKGAAGIGLFGLFVIGAIIFFLAKVFKYE